MNYLTLSMDNKTSIHCPLFNVDTQVRACVTLRSKVFQGQQVEVRRGCQAALASCKCPMMHVISRMAFGRSNVGDELGSTEPVLSKLPGDILVEILPIMIQEVHLRRYGVSKEETLILETANERIEKQILVAPNNFKAPPRANVVKGGTPRGRSKALPAPSVADTAIIEAAASGDMSAAINS